MKTLGQQTSLMHYPHHTHSLHYPSTDVHKISPTSQTLQTPRICHSSPFNINLVEFESTSSSSSDVTFSPFNSNTGFHTPPDSQSDQGNLFYHSNEEYTNERLSSSNSGTSFVSAQIHESDQFCVPSLATQFEYEMSKTYTNCQSVPRQFNLQEAEMFPTISQVHPNSHSALNKSGNQDVWPNCIDTSNLTADITLTNKCLTKKGSNKTNDNEPGSKFKGKLDVEFLLPKENSAEDSVKYGKIARVIESKDTLPKLFIVRGRAIDTRITFTLRDKEVSNIKSNMKLRFTPFTPFGGVPTPVIGCNDPIQGTNVIKHEQLCFIQIVENGKTTAEYKQISDGHLVMECGFLSPIGIYRLLFPFLNSKCPSTWKKDVHIGVSLLDETETEIGRTEFEVISCASPMRDARRFLQRQSAPTSHAVEKLPDKVGTVRLSDWVTNSPSRSLCVKSMVSATAISSSQEISPLSSRFESLCSPAKPLEDESLTDFHQGNLLGNDSVREPLSTLSIATSIELDNSNSWDYFASTNEDAIHLECKTRCEDSNQSPLPITQTVEINREKIRKRPSKPVSEEHDETDGKEYIIRTKSRRIYRILSILNKELSGEF